MFEQIIDHVNFNYQANRVLSFGEQGCDRGEVIEAMQHVTGIKTWYNAWRTIAERALHAQYVLLSDG